MRLKFTRADYLPRGLPVRVRQYDDLPGAMVATYTAQGHPYAIVWFGKAQKPCFHFRFLSVEQMEKRIANALDAQRQRAASMAERRTKGQAPHPLREGQILRSSWGYDQTNVDFYEVTRVIGPRTVEIREIESRIANPGSCGGESVAPAPGKYIGPAKVKHPTPDGTVKVRSFAYAYPWKGEPSYQTASGWGH